MTRTAKSATPRIAARHARATRRQQREGTEPAPASQQEADEPAPTEPRQTRAEQLIALMRAEGGATGAELAAAVGWQLHSVRGFIAGTLKKRDELVVNTVRVEGVTRYSVADRERVEP